MNLLRLLAYVTYAFALCTLFLSNTFIERETVSTEQIFSHLGFKPTGIQFETLPVVQTIANTLKLPTRVVYAVPSDNNPNSSTILAVLPTFPLFSFLIVSCMIFYFCICYRKTYTFLTMALSPLHLSGTFIKFLMAVEASVAPVLFDSNIFSCFYDGLLSFSFLFIVLSWFEVNYGLHYFTLLLAYSHFVTTGVFVALGEMIHLPKFKGFKGTLLSYAVSLAFVFIELKASKRHMLSIILDMSVFAGLWSTLAAFLGQSSLVSLSAVVAGGFYVIVFKYLGVYPLVLFTFVTTLRVAAIAISSPPIPLLRESAVTVPTPTIVYVPTDNILALFLNSTPHLVALNLICPFIGPLLMSLILHSVSATVGITALLEFTHYFYITNFFTPKTHHVPSDAFKLGGDKDICLARKKQIKDHHNNSLPTRRHRTSMMMKKLSSHGLRTTSPR